MSGAYTGTVVSSPLRRGTWAEYWPADNVGLVISSPLRRGTWAQYGEADRRRSGITVGVGFGGSGMRTGN